MTLARIETTALSTDLQALVQTAADVAKDDAADATKRAYAGQFARFELWCRATGLPALPTTEAVVTTYITALAEAGRKMATIEQAIAAIAYTHREAGHTWDKSPAALQRTRKGFRRRLTVAITQKSPVEDVHLKRMLVTCGDDLLGKRDRALLLVGWGGAFRRSEIVGLNVGDVDVEEEGLRIHLVRSKTDQLGAGYYKGLTRNDDPALCVATALQAWLEAAGIQEGALFRILGRDQVLGERLAPRAVALMIKARMTAAGYDASTYSGHSLRAGFVTSAAKHDKPIDEIQRQTGHKSLVSLTRYVRHATLFTKNATKGLLR